MWLSNSLRSSERGINMIKRVLFVTTITLMSSQYSFATPLLPIDARGLAMGSTGVASAKLAHAPQYNPALLSTAAEDEDFAIIIPQIGVVVADEEKLVESFDDLANEDYADDGNGNQEPIIDHFDTILTNLDNILVNGPNPVEQQIKDLELLLPNNINTSDPNLLTIANDLDTAATTLDNSISGVQAQTSDLQQTTFDLTTELDSLSGNPLRGTLGINGAIAIPSKTFAAAVSVSGSAYFSGRMFFTDNDQQLFNDYAGAIDDYAGEVKDYTGETASLAQTLQTFADLCDPSSPNFVNSPARLAQCQTLTTQADAKLTSTNNELDDLSSFSRTSGDTVIITTDANGNIVIAEDPDLTSNVQIIAVAITEIGLTLSRSFNIAGENIAIGITPKLQTIKTFNFVTTIEDEEIDEEDVTDTEQDFSDFNIDLGAAYQFGADKQWQVGLVARNLLSKEYQTVSNEYGSTGNTLTSETLISLDTQFRGGVSHTTEWTVIAIDIDLMENDPVAFESPTQYASIGAEFDLFDTLQLRAGYRTNLSASDASVASVGLGLSPFGLHLDIAAMANPNDPEKEIGAAIEFGLYF